MFKMKFFTIIFLSFILQFTGGTTENMLYFKTKIWRVRELVVVVMIFLFFTTISITRASVLTTGYQNRIDSLRILSYNMRIAHPPSKGWSEVDLPAIAQVINKANPNFVALQEVDAFTERSGKKIHQAHELAKMTGMYHFFAKAIDRSAGDYGVAILSRFPLTETKGYRLPVRDSIKNEIRALAVVKALLPNEETIVFCSAHFDHLANEDRLLQAETMNAILEKYSANPVIIGADLNMEPDNPVMKVIQKSFSLGIDDHPLTFPSVNPKRTIDYILLNKIGKDKFDVVKYNTLKEDYASDHLPLEVVLKIK
jgi:endonuclease/exonuclease/phosphatase family metal-dependent hydrolase